MNFTGALFFKLFMRAAGIFFIFFGSWLARAPKKAIEFQIAFYRHINWRMEPIDWDREVHSTVVMGWTAMICGAGMFVLVW